jgi:hypothetical protein
MPVFLVTGGWCERKYHVFELGLSGLCVSHRTAQAERKLSASARCRVLTDANRIQE